MDALRLRLGRTIRRLRTASGYSQESFADLIGVHRTYMGAVERGETNISLDNLSRIADGCELTLSALFAEVERDATSDRAKGSSRTVAAHRRTR